MEKHIASEFRNIMISDSKVGETESLNREVLAVGNIFSKFNSISYTKGLLYKAINNIIYSIYHLTFTIFTQVLQSFISCHLFLQISINQSQTI